MRKCTPRAARRVCTSGCTPAGLHLSRYAGDETGTQRGEGAPRPGANRAIGVQNLYRHVYLRSRIHLCASPSTLHEHVWKQRAGDDRRAHASACGLSTTNCHRATGSARTDRGEQNGFEGLPDQRRRFRRVTVAARSLPPVVLCACRRAAESRAPTTAVRQRSLPMCTNTPTATNVDGFGSPVQKGPSRLGS